MANSIWQFINKTLIQMKNTVHYALVLDQSGSMESLKEVTISSFNEQIDSIRGMIQKHPDSEVKVTLCVFNEDVELRMVAAGIDQVEKLGHHNYRPNSCTALYDAMGITLLRMQETIQPADKVFLAFFTDGHENASRNYSLADIVHKLDDAKLKGWNIRFYCNTLDLDYFRERLRLNESDMQGITLNDNGVRLMQASMKNVMYDIIRRK